MVAFKAWTEEWFDRFTDFIRLSAEFGRTDEYPTYFVLWSFMLLNGGLNKTDVDSA